MCKIATVIDARLKELGIKGSKMCDDLGISRSTLTELRKGRVTTMKADRADAIAKYLGISVETLLGTTNGPATPEDDKPISDADIKAAFFGGDTDLTEEERDEIWDDVMSYYKFKMEQKRRKRDV